ncbi:HlyD family secretion protein [Thiocystis violascens]|uniref:Multidrug resistance efflux pump n=1 Tax=Thiocystis violascens (strain ATCC 17096 / DSM 198 / 6111) TaxID=765911 RepID=I3YD68_THIV6|nr:HlyD family efflux transporter periplasmic adaptor subunit [Thiocystis violascens]AFL74936.1 multidrug resistance efflux pump [Thiocystis violascens DSM 198]
MQRIRPKIRVDQLRSEARPVKRGAVGRYVYLALLLFFVFYLIDIVTEGLFFLEGEGMIVRDAQVIAAERVATVTELSVKLGDEVTEGQRLARLRSQDALETLVRLTADLTQAEFSLTEMRIRSKALNGLIDEARIRVSWNENARRELSRADKEGLLIRHQGAQMVDDTYQSISELRQLEIERDTIAAELPSLETRVMSARQVLDALTGVYNDGYVHAPAKGTVGALEVELGSVVKVGDQVLRIHEGSAYVLAYLPTGSFHRVREGESVTLRDGIWVATGRVERILPLATVLPPEFKRAFEAVRTQQIVRIALSGATEPPPLFTKVEISWEHSPWGWVARALERLRMHLDPDRATMEVLPSTG